MQPTGKIRLEAFSDGVFAIAITLLALELHVPAFLGTTFLGSLHELIPLIPSMLTFVLSFITIAIFWVNHHQLTQNFSTITKRRILWSNILFLLFLTLIPFVTAAVSISPTAPLAVFFYSLVLLGSSLSFTLMRYFVHKGCGQSHIPMTRSLIGPIVYLLAVIASIFSVWIAYFLLAIPALFYFLPKGSLKETDE
ncbi:MAG TPA: TMEM175 family protein [Candidatus Paceibacterota bacterium]